MGTAENLYIVKCGPGYDGNAPQAFRYDGAEIFKVVKHLSMFIMRPGDAAFRSDPPLG